MKSAEKKEPYIPHIETPSEDEVMYTQTPRPKRPMGVLPSPYHNEVDEDNEQYTADLSSLPVGKRPGEDSVTIKKSPQDEILNEEGGMFDKFLERKRVEFEEMNKAIDAEAEASGLTPISIDEFEELQEGKITMEELKEKREEEKRDISNSNTNEIDIFADEEENEKSEESFEFEEDLSLKMLA